MLQQLPSKINTMLMVLMNINVGNTLFAVFGMELKQLLLLCHWIE